MPKKSPEFEIEGGPDTPQSTASPADERPAGDGSVDGPREDPDDEDDEVDDDEDDDGRDHTPSKDITDAELNQIKTGIKAIKIIQWPGSDFKRVALRPLSRHEIYQGAASALQTIEDYGIDKDDIFEKSEKPDGSFQIVTWLELAQRDEWLCIALRRADDFKRPLFNTSDEMRKKLTSLEIGKLYDILASHMMATVPLTMAEKLATQESYLEIVSILKKKPGEILLAALPHGMLRELVIFMVEKLVILPTTN